MDICSSAHASVAGTGGGGDRGTRPSLLTGTSDHGATADRAPHTRCTMGGTSPDHQQSTPPDQCHSFPHVNHFSRFQQELLELTCVHIATDACRELMAAQHQHSHSSLRACERAGSLHRSAAFEVVQRPAQVLASTLGILPCSVIVMIIITSATMTMTLRARVR